MGLMNYKHLTAINDKMDHTKTLLSTEIFAGAIQPSPVKPIVVNSAPALNRSKSEGVNQTDGIQWDMPLINRSRDSSALLKQGGPHQARPTISPSHTF
jgi:hypothetical protein